MAHKTRFNEFDPPNTLGMSWTVGCDCPVFPIISIYISICFDKILFDCMSMNSHTRQNILGSLPKREDLKIEGQICIVAYGFVMGIPTSSYADAQVTLYFNNTAVCLENITASNSFAELY